MDFKQISKMARFWDSATFWNCPMLTLIRDILEYLKNVPALIY